MERGREDHSRPVFYRGCRLKKALLIAVNRYPTAPLRGCLNDCEDWHKILTTLGKYPSDNIRAVCDERATTQGIRDRMAWLKEGLKGPGDEVFFAFSGHGSQVRDRGVLDELADNMDEILCLAGETKIPLMNGTTRTVEDLAASGEPFWVYSMDADGNVRVGRAEKAWMTSEDAPLLRVILDNGESVRCTAGHPWKMRDGSYRRASDLRPGDSLMPLYRRQYATPKGRKRYEEVFNPNGECSVPTHKFAAGPCPAEITAKASEQGCGVVVHHIDMNHRNNAPENLVWMTWKDHAKLHKASPEARVAASCRAKEMWRDPDIRERTHGARSAAAHRRWEEPSYREKISEATKRQDITPMRDGNRKYLGQMTAEDRAEKARKAGSTRGKKSDVYAELARARWQDPEYRAKMVAAQSAAMKRRWANPEERKALRHGGSVAVNHKVISITPDEHGPVYDICVPGYENFAVEAGVFLHNCPVDLDWNTKVITDDDIGDWLKTFPKGTKITVILDCCHSGTGTREIRPPQENPHYKADRYLPPPLDIALRAEGLATRKGVEISVKIGRGRGKRNGWREAKANGKKKSLFWWKNPCSKPKPAPISTPVATMNHVLIAGCRSDQTSADALINSRYNGALTCYLATAMRLMQGKPIREVHALARKSILDAGYTQDSQLEGPESLLTQPMFLP